MGVDLTLSGHDPEPFSQRLCTNRAFDQVCRWMDSVPGDQFPAVKAFRETFRHTPTDELARQLNAAANAHRPDESDGTAEAVLLFLDRIGAGEPGETAEVTFD